LVEKTTDLKDQIKSNIMK